MLWSVCLSDVTDVLVCELRARDGIKSHFFAFSLFLAGAAFVVADFNPRPFNKKSLHSGNNQVRNSKSEIAAKKAEKDDDGN